MRIINACLWKIEEDENKGITYKIQVNNIKACQVEKVKDILKEWQPAGSGFERTTDFKILLFKKTFKNQKSLLKWKKSFPYHLEISLEE